MRYHVVSLLLIFCISCLPSNSQSFNSVNTTRNGDNAVADGIVVRDSQGKLFDKIYVEHKDVGSLTNLSWIKDGEISVYISKQEEVIKHIKTTMLRKIPVQFLRSSIEYKFNPIICHLAVSVCDGVIRKVSFQVNREISYLLSDNDIMALEDIVLNTQFIPYNPETGDYISIYFPVGKKLISEFLNSGNREDCP